MPSRSLEPSALLGAAMVVGEDRFEGADIRVLYEKDHFPLSRDK